MENIRDKTFKSILKLFNTLEKLQSLFKPIMFLVSISMLLSPFV